MNNDNDVRTKLTAKFETIRNDVVRSDGFRPVYVTAPDVINRLNDALSHLWDFRVINHQVIQGSGGGGQIIVLGELQANIGGIHVVKQQFGSAYIKASNGQAVDFGSDLKAATTDCLKKCATMLGVALELYDKDESPMQGLNRVGAQVEGGSYPQQQMDPSQFATQAQIDATRKFFTDAGIHESQVVTQLGLQGLHQMTQGLVQQIFSGQHPLAAFAYQRMGNQPGVQSSR